MPGAQGTTHKHPSVLSVMGLCQGRLGRGKRFLRRLNKSDGCVRRDKVARAAVVPR